MTPDSLRQLARYNRWANGRLYDAVASLDPDQFIRPRPSFFGSIMATLNHNLLADLVWMGRFTGIPAAGITALDQILHPDLDGLAQARAQLDAAIVAYFDGPLGALDQPFTYANLAGAPMRTPLGLTMLHMFNHGTHHRGQVHDMLSATEVAPPSLDLVYFLREAG